jgi:hypothetical protein
VAAPEGLAAAVDQVIAFFNAKKMDLPDGFFARGAQFLINDAPFETLLGQPPADPLVLMLTRGAAGFRFTSKTLQHAVPDARVDRGDLVTDGDPFKVMTKLWLSGTLRGTGEALNVVVEVTLRLNAAGEVERAAAVMDAGTLDKLRQARLQP